MHWLGIGTILSGYLFGAGWIIFWSEGEGVGVECSSSTTGGADDCYVNP